MVFGISQKRFSMRLFFLFLMMYGVVLHAQKQVAITMDDIEQTNSFLPEDYETAMLDTIVSLDIPVAILVCEGHLFRGDTIKRFENIKKWIANPLITVGSHTFSHRYYSDTTFEFYTADIEKGLKISRPLAKSFGKDINYFRFPFNCLGKDSTQHHLMRQYLEVNNLVITPFSVESEDWAYNVLYEHYLFTGDTVKAKEIGQRYVVQTLKMFAFIDSICHSLYNRDVKHIYLCHDLSINEHFLPHIVKSLKEEGYSFITLDEAMTDKVYQSKDKYYQKWGISWIYRYNYDQLKGQLKNEPNDNIYLEYESLMKNMKR